VKKYESLIFVRCSLYV